LLVNNVPAFKLDKSILQRRLDLLQKRGVVFHLGAKLWEQTSLSQLRAEFDAVFLGWDSRRARPLEIPGAQLKGVVPAVPFLLQKTTTLALDLPKIGIAGRRVAVIGAGDTAMDCLRAAIRYGASEVICVYRRDEPDMPCGRQEYKNAVEEGAHFVFCAQPVEVLGDSNGQVSGLRLVRTEVGLPDNGHRPYLIQRGTEFELQTDWVIPALGFEPLGCPQTDPRETPALNDWGGIIVDDHQMTSIPGVFAGGDLVHGPSLMLHAVRDARRAAEQIDTFLSASRGCRS
jgi:glutamate synthase (NADPH/NADH) small chain